ncbi:MAG TPA: hypothetical protein VLI93_04755 [Acetobacteraceae bacterium]|nr:hypothetical protein [Acetobacteraceae bacterium]
MDGKESGSAGAGNKSSAVEQAAMLADGGNAGATGIEQAAELAGGGTAAPGSQGGVRQAKQLAGEARNSAADLVEDVKDRMGSQAEHQKDRAAAQMRQAASSVHRTADALKQNDQGWLGDLVARGADELSSVAERLHRNDLQGLLSQIEGFARRQPALFAGASIAAGFALARMARLATEQATSPDRRPSHAGDGASRAARSEPETDWQSRAETTYPGTMYHG